MRQFGERERGERRFAGGLDHEGAAGGQRGRAFARDHGIGEIPRRDRGDDADRLLQHDEAAARGIGGDHIAIDALTFFGEPFDEGRAIGDLAARFRERLALFGGHDGCEVFLVGHDELEPFAQQHGAFFRGLLFPCRESVMRGVDGGARVGASEIGDISKLRAGRRIGDREGLGAFAPCAVHISVGFEKGCVFQFEHDGPREEPFWHVPRRGCSRAWLRRIEAPGKAAF